MNRTADLNGTDYFLDSFMCLFCYYTFFLFIIFIETKFIVLNIKKGN